MNEGQEGRDRLLSRSTRRVLGVGLTILASLTIAAASTPSVGRTTPSGELARIARFVETNNPLLRKPGVRQAFNRRARYWERLLQKDHASYMPWLAASRLLRSLDDPHTLDVPVRSGVIPMDFFATDGGVTVLPVAGYRTALRMGDRVLALGGVPMDRLWPRLRRVISGNRYWARNLGAAELSVPTVLQWLGVVHAGVVTVWVKTPAGRVEGVRVRIGPATGNWRTVLLRNQIPFENAFQTVPEAPVSITHPSFAWGLNVRADYAVFWLRACQDDAAYRRAVAAFFRAVRQAHITRVVWDLQDNAGGNSSVFLPFVHELRDAPSTIVSYGRTWTTVGPGPLAPSEKYAGRVSVAINGGTFSAAAMCAELLAVNHLATVVGTPSGWLAGPGEVVVRQFGPLLVQTSTETFVAPTGSHGNTLVPRILLPLTLYDVQHHINPIVRWLASAPGVHQDV